MRRIENQSDIDAGLAELTGRNESMALAAALAGTVPLRLKRPGYAALAEIILSQMVSKASADAIWRKLERAAGTVTPEAILALEPGAARAAGLSAAKEATLRRTAEAVDSGALDLDRLCAIAGTEAVAAMTAIKGVGPWTAEVYLLLCAGHADIFPAGDVALQNAAAHLLGLAERPAPKTLRLLAEDWSPWRSVAARLLWAYYSNHMRRGTILTDE